MKLLLVLLPLLGALALSACSEKKQTVVESGEWKRFAAEGIELVLPPNFKGGTVKELEAGIIRSLRDRGETAKAEAVRAGAVGLLLYMTDIDEKATETSVRAAALPIPTSLTLEAIAEQNRRGLSAGKRIAALEYETLDSRRVIRTVIEDSVRDTTTLIYTIKVDATLYVVSYLTDKDNFDSLLPTFENSAASIRIH